MQSPSCTYDLANQQLRDTILLLVNILLHLKRFLDIIVDELAVLIRHETIRLTIIQQLCRTCTHHRCIVTILTGR